MIENNFNWNFHHLGYACKKISEEIDIFRSLGYVNISEIYEDNSLGIYACFLSGNGPIIELVQNIEGFNTLSSMLKHNIKIYHKAFKTKNLSTDIIKLTDQGHKLIVPPTSAVAFNGNKVSFIMLKNQFIIELIEE